MGATWSKTWISTATAFHRHSGQFKTKHERHQRDTIFEFVTAIKDTESLVGYLQERNVLPQDDNLKLKKLNGKKGDRLNEGFKFHVLRSKPTK